MSMNCAGPKQIFRPAIGGRWWPFHSSCAVRSSVLRSTPSTRAAKRSIPASALCLHSWQMPPPGAYEQIQKIALSDEANALRARADVLQQEQQLLQQIVEQLRPAHEPT